MAKDLDSQLVTLANEVDHYFSFFFNDNVSIYLHSSKTMKAMKKQSKKEQQDRDEQLKDKIKEVRKIEALLNTFGDDKVRNDFLEGRDGANVRNFIFSYNLSHLPF